MGDDKEKKMQDNNGAIPAEPVSTFAEIDEDEDSSNIVILSDENGEDVQFEFLDLIEYENEEYVVFLPMDSDDDAQDEVVILKVEESDDCEEESYVSVDDEKTLDEIFKIFKKRYRDSFNFID